MATQEVKRKLTAILNADVKDYSRLMGEDEKGTVRTLNTYKEAMTGLIQHHRGRVVDAPGDNVLAEFASVVDAVECAAEIQKELKTRNAELPENRRMEFRIGVNLGDVIEDGEQILGDGVNIAARLESLADAGGICISGTAFDHVKNKLNLGYKYLGEQTVKNILEPVRVYQVLMEPEAAGKIIGEKKAKPRQWQKTAFIVVSVLILVIATVAIWSLYFRPTPPLEVASKEKMAFPLPDKPSIAVLPFVNMSDDPKQEFFSDGITENIITGLSKISGLFVIARNSSFTYKGKPVMVRQVAEDLGVRYVLEGSVQRSGDRVRITAQFIDALKGHHLWSERYDQDPKDLFAIEDDITKKIITALQVILTKGEQAILLGKGTENLNAYLKCMEANEYLLRMNKDANLMARQRAEEAIALDSKYSSAHAILGNTHIKDVIFNWSASPRESMVRAFESAKKALSLDDSNVQARMVLTWIYLLKREHDKAIEECEGAVSLAPNAADAVFTFGIVLRFAGRVKDAIPMFERAIRLNPIPQAAYLSQLALSYTFIGEFEKAIGVCKKGLSKNPDDLVGRLALVVAYTSLGRESDARAEVAEVLRIDPKFSLEYAAKTWPYKNEADRDLVLNALRKAGLK
jgi:adenylate cyclase